MTKRERTLVWILAAVITALAVTLVAHPLRIASQHKEVAPVPLPPKVAAQHKEAPAPLPKPGGSPAQPPKYSPDQLAMRDLRAWRQTKEE